jgi:hypothetical protein
MHCGVIKGSMWFPAPGSGPWAGLGPCCNIQLHARVLRSAQQLSYVFGHPLEAQVF